MRRADSRGPDDDNIPRRGSARAVLNRMTVEQREDLRQVTRVDEPQSHFRDALRRNGAPDPYGLFQPVSPADNQRTRHELY